MSTALLLKLNNEIKQYDWGSRTAFQSLFNYKNHTHEPQAEVWMGTHPAGPSHVSNINGEKHRLDTLISGAPIHYLGQRVAKQFSDLPFLFKVLASEKPLSIQVHPNKVQAEEGFEKENKNNIHINAPHRNYKDPNHKPELVYALTPFEALNGFRPIDEILKCFSSIRVPTLQKELSLLIEYPSCAQLTLFFKHLLTLNTPTKEQAIKELLISLDSLSESIAQVIKQLSQDYPDDIGLFMPLLLNVITLKPGEAMYLDAMTPHAYLHGVALEIMACSDNVLRAGLTNKHIDVNELLKNTHVEAKPIHTLLTEPVREKNQLFFPVPVEDFKFSIIQSHVTPHCQTVAGPEILFCISGQISIESGSECWQLSPGESLFVAAAAGSYQYVGEGQLARAFI